MAHTHVAITSDGTTFFCAQCAQQLTSAEATQEDPQETGIARCETCGTAFQIEDGYYEPNEYAYCGNCCHW